MNAYASFRRAVLHVAAGELAEAARAAARASGEGELYAQAARWLSRAARDGIAGAYADARGFTAYSSAGSARELREKRIAELARIYGHARPASLLDVGAGDGAVTAGALARDGPSSLERIDLVEPSADLLARARERVAAAAPAADVQSVNAGAETFVAAARPDARWDLAQAILSLQSLERPARAAVLRWLAARVSRLVVVEFDVEADMDAPLSDATVRAIHDRFVEGVAQYTGRVDAAAEDDAKQHFLMPILFGYFSPGPRRSTHEQTIHAWSDEVSAAGLVVETCHRLASHWWSDAYAIVARGSAHEDASGDVQARSRSHPRNPIGRAP